MRISPVTINYKVPRTINFKGSSGINQDNIDKFIDSLNFSIEENVQDLYSIHNSAYKEKVNALREQRNKNRIEEQNKVVWKNPLTINKIFKSKEILEQLIETQNVETPGIVNGLISYDEYMRYDFKKGADYFAKNVENSSFKNNIFLPNLDISEINSNIGKNGVENIKNFYIQFRDNDTELFRKSMVAISNISNNYFTHATERIKEINGTYSKSEKWIERIPVGGLIPRVDRVCAQQSAVKFVYQDYKEYCNKFLHNGIIPIAQNYVEKINRIDKYIELITPYISNSDIDFVETASSNIQKIAFPHVKKYMKIMDSIIKNGSDISKYYKSINQNGNVSSGLKTLGTVLIMI